MNLRGNTRQRKPHTEKLACWGFIVAESKNSTRRCMNDLARKMDTRWSSKSTETRPVQTTPCNRYHLLSLLTVDSHIQAMTLKLDNVIKDGWGFLRTATDNERRVRHTSQRGGDCSLPCHPFISFQLEEALGMWFGSRLASKVFFPLTSGVGNLCLS